MDLPSKWEARFLAEARRTSSREWRLRRRLVVFLAVLMAGGLIGYLAAVLRDHWPPDTGLITPILLGVSVLVYCATAFHYFGLMQGASEVHGRSP